MNAVLNIVLISLVLIIIAILFVTYRGTFTPLGRLDYFAAIISILTSKLPLPNFTKEERVTSNKRTKRILGKSDPSLVASIKDYSVGVDKGVIIVRVYTPKGDGPFPMVLELHGGGFWMGNEFCMEKPIIEMAAKIPAVVVSVDYRLIPDFTYPIPLDDCAKALIWAIEHSDDLKVDSNRIALMGASAGGNLASALAIKLRDEGGPKIKYQFLSVPVTDLVNFNWKSFDEAGDKYMCKASKLKVVDQNYVPDPKNEMKHLQVHYLHRHIRGYLRHWLLQLNLIL